MTSPPRVKPEENAKREKKHENNPCTLPTKDIEKNVNLISIRVRTLESRRRVRIFGVRGNRCRHVRPRTKLEWRKRHALRQEKSQRS